MKFEIYQFDPRIHQVPQILVNAQGLMAALEAIERLETLSPSTLFFLKTYEGPRRGDGMCSSAAPATLRGGVVA